MKKRRTEVGENTSEEDEILGEEERRIEERERKRKIDRERKRDGKKWD